MSSAKAIRSLTGLFEGSAVLQLQVQRSNTGVDVFRGMILSCACYCLQSTADEVACPWCDSGRIDRTAHDSDVQRMSSCAWVDESVKYHFKQPTQGTCKSACVRLWCPCNCKRKPHYTSHTKIAEDPESLKLRGPRGPWTAGVDNVQDLANAGSSKLWVAG